MSLTPIYRKGNCGEEAKKTGTDTGNFRGQGAGQDPRPSASAAFSLSPQPVSDPDGAVRGRPLPFLEAKAPRLGGPILAALERVPWAHPSRKVAWSQPPSPSPRLPAGEG